MSNFFFTTVNTSCLEIVTYQHLYFDIYSVVVFWYLVFALCISLILAILSVLVSFRSSSLGGELGSAYECGFLPFDKSRVRFDVNFFVVGLLFLLFDLEVIFVLPWGLVVSGLSFVGFAGGVFFFIVLGLAFFYEIYTEALLF